MRYSDAFLKPIGGPNDKSNSEILLHNAWWKQQIQYELELYGKFPGLVFARPANKIHSSAMG